MSEKQKLLDLDDFEHVSDSQNTGVQMQQPVASAPHFEVPPYATPISHPQVMPSYPVEPNTNLYPLLPQQPQQQQQQIMPQKPLPYGWEQRVEPNTGRFIFVID